MARSSTRGRRPPPRTASPSTDSPPSGAGLASGPSLASATLPRVWQGIGYRVLDDPAVARPLFDFAAVPWPPASGELVYAWGAFAPCAEGERLVGAMVVERGGRAMFLHGPVVTSDAAPLEIAAQLVGAGLDHASALGARTVFARPQGLDRVWVRFGFIPVPEGALPAALAGRPGRGLFAWRGGSALWSLRDTEPD